MYCLMRAKLTKTLLQNLASSIAEFEIRHFLSLSLSLNLILKFNEIRRINTEPKFGITVQVEF